MNTTVHKNGTVQFTFFLVKKLEIGSFIVIFESYFSSLKIKNGLKKHIQNLT